ncbi:hypothetical protein ACET3X_007273 [Alternaria dauci]|uniref:Uncharacterized protein n=1 Tax=Alternaria dauci TaxID=48095 RepID=A0ABR3UBG8_9PLEO
MRSFAVIAGFAAVALAAPQYEAYPAAPASSSAPAEYPAYPAESSSAPAYEAASSAAEYPSYPAETSAAYEASKPAYEASSAAPVYSATKPAYTTTEVVHATSYVCPEPTTITYGASTYTISSSTTLSIPEYTATYVHTPSAEVPTVPKPTASVTASVSGHPSVPEASHTAPGYSAAPPAPLYPSSNGTVPHVPAGTGYPTGTGAVPSSTKPATPEFTGAAGKVTVGFFAIAGAVAAFL